MEGLETQFGPLHLETPLVSASGIYGVDYETVAPSRPWMGAAVLKSISLHPRLGNPEPRIVETRAGMLNAVGIQNPGVDAYLAEELPRLRALTVPIIASIMGTEASEYAECARLLLPHQEFVALELNVSCPNLEKGGIEFGCDAPVLEKLVSQVKQVWNERPLIVKLTPNIADISEIARASIRGGADALCMINTLRGMAIDLDRQRPVLGNKVGGLSGIGIHPVAVYAVYKCYTACCREYNIPIIGVGGVTNAEEALELILAGATCVGIGTAMFRRPNVFEEVGKGMIAYLERKGIGSVRELIGKAAQ
jgi:dihydroorotate dehydrogenase (NAD+) catalytic subunit